MAKKRVHTAREEHGLVRFLGRQVRHLVQVASILLVHVGVRYFAHRLGLEHEWWVKWLEMTSAVLSVFVFIFTTGVEAVVECWLTAYSGWTRIRNTMRAAPEEPEPKKRTGV